MDGFESNEGVILIAADEPFPMFWIPALAAPRGAFWNRRVVVAPPRCKGPRRDSSGYTHARFLFRDDVDLSIIARRHAGLFRRPTWANLVNERLCGPGGRTEKFVLMDDF